MDVKYDVVHLGDPEVKDMSDIEKTAKRYPNLGPTRQETTQDTRDNCQIKPRTADLISRSKHHSRYRSPDFHVAKHLSIGQCYQHHPDRFIVGKRPKTCVGHREFKPPHHRPYQASAGTRTDHQGVAGTADGQKQVAESGSSKDNSNSNSNNNNSSAVRSKNRFSTLAYRGPQEDFENPPRYCIISSAGAAKSREHSSLSASRHRKELLSQRAPNSFVITADTTSLLVESKSAHIFRSVSDVGARSKSNSAISQVHRANQRSKTDLDADNTGSHNKSTGSFSNVPKSKSAHARSSLPKDIDSTVQSDAKLRQYYAFVNDTFSIGNSTHYTSYDNLSEDNPNTRKVGTNTEEPSDNGSNMSCTFVTVHRVTSDDSLARHKFKVDENAPPYLSMPQSSGLPLIFSNPLNIASHGSSMTSKSNAGNGPTTLKSKPGNSKGRIRTVAPSKHGFHPRSQSPTFRRLVAAAERLEETYSRDGSFLSLAASKNAPAEQDSDLSSDSLRRLRYYKDYLNGFDQSDYTSDDSTVKKCPVGRTPGRESVGSLEVRQSRKKSINDRMKYVKKHVDEKPPKYPGDKMSLQREAGTRESTDDSSGGPPSRANDDVLLKQQLQQQQLLAFNGAVEPPKEPERRVMNGQPTQLHFFLPQLGDNMSEISGGTLTGRSFYQEQRIDLLNRNELLHNPVAEEKATPSHSRGRDNKPKNASHCNVNNHNNNNISNNSKYSEKFSKSSGTGAKQQRPYNQSSGVVNGFGERGSGQRESRNLSLSPARDDPTRSKRYVSPLRSKNSNWDSKPARRKTSQSNYKLVPYEYTYLESQLPSEKLKKQIDNFPTLVSMDFSDNTTPSQSR